MTLAARKSCHRINKRCRLFYRAIQKYGFEVFVWSILEEPETQELLDSREEFWIKQLKADHPESGYNLKSGGFGNGKHSEETKRRLSEIAKISGRKPPICPTANPDINGRRAWSAQRGGIPFDARTKEGLFVGIFASVGHAATVLGLQRCHIRNNLKGRKATCCGYVFSYHQSASPIGASIATR